MQTINYRAMKSLCRTPRKSKLSGPTHQLTGHEAGGKKVFMMGTLKSLKGWETHYRQRGGYDLEISERVQDQSGLTARRLY